MKKLFCYVFIFLVSSISQSSAIQNSLPKGAGLLLHVQVSDLDRYIDELSQKSEVLFSSGAAAAGYCIVKSGHNYPGEVTIWQLFKSMGELMKAINESDPMNKPQLNFSKMRDIKYMSIWKDMKEVNLKPGFEMVERWNIPPENLSDFVSTVRDLESNLKEISGIDFEMAVAFNVGSGSQETDLVMTRWITSDGETMGKLLDSVYDSVGFLPSYNKALNLGQKINSQLEECKPFFIQ
ncbi:MAG: hypothetical protein ACJZ4P_06040 [Candidatus Micropelagos sp.]